MVIVAQLVEPRIVVPVVVGSSPIGHPRLAITKTRSSIYGIATEGHEGPLAQLVEQLTLNQRVVGSIPTRPTILGDFRNQDKRMSGHRNCLEANDNEYEIRNCTDRFCPADSRLWR